MQEVVVDTQDNLIHNDHISRRAPWEESPYRLMSWWDMEQFSAEVFYRIAVSLDQLGNEFTWKSERKTLASIVEGLDINPSDRKRLTGFIGSIQALCRETGLSNSVKVAGEFLEELSESTNKIRPIEVSSRVEELDRSIRREMESHLFMHVPDGLQKYYKQEKLFGDAVYNAFPSARFDVVEAGTCLACGSNTAAGFHLMRAAEIGLWELGKDRQIRLAQENKVEFKEWGEIIKKLEDEIVKIQQWVNSPSKEDAHKFYNSALVEIRAFNDGWRRHIAHVRKHQQPLQEDETLALYGHVKRFLEKLSTKISEGNYTPLVWLGDLS